MNPFLNKNKEDNNSFFTKFGKKIYFTFSKKMNASFSKKFINKKDPSKSTITLEESEIIAKSIPSLNVKKRIKVTGFTLISLLAFLGIVSIAFYIIAINHTYSIGIGSYSNYNDYSSRVFFVFFPSFWSNFVMEKTYTIYSFFRNIQANISNAAEQNAFLFALSFYISFFTFLIQVCLMFVLLSISIYQKNLRNFFISLFSLIPIIGAIICIYYLGVLHFEHTFKYQKFVNKSKTQIEQNLDLKEQLEVLNESIAANLLNKSNNIKPLADFPDKPSSIKPLSDQSKSLKNDKDKIKSDAFSYKDPIGKIKK